MSGGELDILVVGAGVVGLATAAELAGTGRSLLVVERNAAPGRETSSRSSEVIHAGLYYPVGSRKARLCVEGNALLYELCERDGVAHRRIEKLVVATSHEELPALERLLALGLANGARSLQMLEGAALRELEPALRLTAAIHSPSTGIVDSHGLVKALEARLRAAGGGLLLRCALEAIEPLPRGGFRCRLRHPGGSESVESRVVVNAAGLESDRVARLAGVDRYELHWCKGDYFSVSGPPARAVSHLVYPVPAGPGACSLGVHVTLDLAGRMRLGPDATYVARDPAPSLDVAPEKAEAFFLAARALLPGLELEHLQPDTAGLRPKLQGPGDGFRDFAIEEESCAGRPGLVSLVGIESPGLTACLAIAREVRTLVDRFLG